MFPLTITINSFAELNAVLAVLNGKDDKTAASAQATVAQNGASNPPSTSSKKTPAAVAAPETASVTDSPAATDAARVPPMSASEAEKALFGHVNPPEPVKAEPVRAVTFDDLKMEFLRLVNTNRETALAVLKKFGLAKLSEAKPEQFGEIFAAVQGA